MLLHSCRILMKKTTHRFKWQIIHPVASSAPGMCNQIWAIAWKLFLCMFFPPSITSALACWRFKVVKRNPSIYISKASFTLWEPFGISKHGFTIPVKPDFQSSFDFSWSEGKASVPVAPMWLGRWSCDSSVQYIPIHYVDEGKRRFWCSLDSCVWHAWLVQ